MDPNGSTMPGFKNGYFGMFEINILGIFLGENSRGNHPHRINVWKFCLYIYNKIHAISCKVNIPVSSIWDPNDGLEDDG